MSINRKRPVVPHPTDSTAALVELTKGKWAIVDAADATAVGAFNWCAMKKKTNWYAARGWRSGRSRGQQSLHQFIADVMGIGDAEYLDHVNGDGLDCRRANIRRATAAQNAHNARLLARNTSGVKGATWNRRLCKWECYLQANKVRHYVGVFESLDAARAALASRRVEVHGEYANHGN